MKIKNWYGETDQERYEDFLSAFKESHNFSESDFEIVAPALWRRHGLDAFKILDLMHEDQENTLRIFPELDLTFGEVKYMLENELVQKPQDLWRRRTAISLLRNEAEISENPLIKRVNSYFEPEIISKV